VSQGRQALPDQRRSKRASSIHDEDPAQPLALDRLGDERIILEDPHGLDLAGKLADSTEIAKNRLHELDRGPELVT
jgi:hypothetical protein